MVVAGAVQQQQPMLILCFMVSYGETHSVNAGSMLGKNQKRFIGVLSRMVFRAYPDKRKTYTIPLVGEFLFVSQFPETIIQAPKKARVLLLVGTLHYQVWPLTQFFSC